MKFLAQKNTATRSFRPRAVFYLVFFASMIPFSSLASSDDEILDKQLGGDAFNVDGINVKPTPGVSPDDKIALTKRYGIHDPVQTVENITAVPDSQIPTTQTNSVNSMGSTVDTAKEAKFGELAIYARNSQKVTEIRDDSVKAAQSNLKVKKLDPNANTPAATAELAKTDDLIKNLKLNFEKNRPADVNRIKQVSDPEIRKDLYNAAVAQAVNLDYEVKKTQAKNSILELAKMAAATMQAASAMNSLTSKSNSTNLNLPPPKSITAGRALASDPNGGKTGISDQMAESRLAEMTKAGNELDAAMKEHAELKKALDEKAKKNIREAIREKLKSKLAGESGSGSGKSGRSKAAVEDAAQLFGGELTGDKAPAVAATNSESASKSEAPMDYGLFQPIKTGEGLAGPETDAEVGRHLAEISSNEDDVKSGILGTETRDLFQRVRLAHQNCLRQKCVASRSN